MTVEAVTFINSLNSALPRNSDLIKEGDDHIRNIKAALKLTFPNFNSRINVSSDALNALTRVVTVDTDTSTLNIAGPVKVAASTNNANPLNMGGNKITNVGTPTSANDVVTLGTLGLAAAASIFPVGSVWMNSRNDKDPNTLFPGTTWTKEAFQGRVLVGAGTLADGSGTAARTFTVGQMGGAYSHQLSVSEMPIHTHGIGSLSVSISSSGAHSHLILNSYLDRGNSHHIGHGSQEIGGTNRQTEVGGAHTHSATVSGQIGNSGGGAAFDIIQPYVAVNIWNRTA